MYIGVHVKYRYSCQILKKFEFFRQSFEEYSNMNFHENPSSGSRVVPCGQTDRQTDERTERQGDMTKLTVTFRNFAKAPENDFKFPGLRYLNEEYVSLLLKCGEIL
jgi:hypothetical protein